MTKGKAGEREKPNAHGMLDVQSAIDTGVPFFDYAYYLHWMLFPETEWGVLRTGPWPGFSINDRAPEYFTKNAKRIKGEGDPTGFLVWCKTIKEMPAIIAKNLGPEPNAEALRAAASMSYYIREYEDAVAYAAAIPEKTGMDKVFHAYFAYMSESGRESSVDKFKDVLIDDPSPFSYHNLSVAICKEPVLHVTDPSRWKAALALREKAASMSGCPPYIYIGYAAMVAAFGPRNSLAEIVSAGAGRYKDPGTSANLKTLLAIGLLQDGRNDEAMALMNEIVSAGNPTVTILLSVMSVHASAGRTEEFKRALRKTEDFLNKIEPDCTLGDGTANHKACMVWTHSRIKIGGLLVSLGMQDEAVKQYAKILNFPHDEFSCLGRLALAEMYLSSGAIKKAGEAILPDLEAVGWNRKGLLNYHSKYDDFAGIVALICASEKLPKKILGAGLLAAYRIEYENSISDDASAKDKDVKAVNARQKAIVRKAERLVKIPDWILAEESYKEKDWVGFVRHSARFALRNAAEGRDATLFGCGEKPDFAEWIKRFKKEEGGAKKTAAEIHSALMEVFSEAETEAEAEEALRPILLSWIPVLGSHAMYSEYGNAVDLVLALLPDDAWIWTHRAWVSHILGRGEDARKAIETAISKEESIGTDGERAEIRYWFAQIELRDENIDSAKKLADEAASMCPDNKKYGDLCAEIEKKKRQEEFYKTARQRYFGLDTHKKRLLATLHSIAGLRSEREIATLSGLNERTVYSGLRFLERDGFIENTEDGYNINEHVVDLLQDQHIKAGAKVAANPQSRSDRSIFRSDGEKTAYRILTTVLPNFLVLPNVSLQAILGFDEMKAAKENGRITSAEFSYFLYSYADFCVVSTMTYTPHICFELDSKTHDNPDRAAKDAMKDNLFEAGGVPLVRIRFYGHLNEEEAKAEIIKAMQGAGVIAGLAI